MILSLFDVGACPVTELHVPPLDLRQRAGLAIGLADLYGVRRAVWMDADEDDETPCEGCGSVEGYCACPRRTP